MKAGKITLKRKNDFFTAGFGIVVADFKHLKKLIPLLHEKEFLYYNNLIYENKSYAFLQGRLATKEALSIFGTRNKIEATYIENGVFSFPVLCGGAFPDLSVCISHCDNIGISLVFNQKHPIGIDIERIDESSSQTMKKSLTSSDIEILQAIKSNNISGYTLFWTVKESLSKVLKTGLTLDFNYIEIEKIIKKEGHYETCFVKFKQYKAISLVYDTYIFSMVLPKFTTPDLVQINSALQEALQQV